MSKRLVLCLFLVASQTTFTQSDTPVNYNAIDEVKNVREVNVTDDSKTVVKTKADIITDAEDSKTVDKTNADDITEVEVGVMSLVFALFWLGGAFLFFWVSSR